MFGGWQRKFSGLFIRADTIDQEYSVARGTLGDIAFSGVNDKAEIIRHDNPASVYDFNATLLHLMGLDHERLTFYHNGLERRLTNVHGHVLHDLIA